MPTETALVGAQLMPVPTGGTNSAISDPTIDGLLAFLGFLISDALTPKLAEMGGPISSTPIADACPAANRFPWDHGGSFPLPIAGQTLASLPGLWCWEIKSNVVEQTLYYDVAQRDIALQYIFPILTRPNGIRARHGIWSVVEKCFQRAVSFGNHPNFAYGNDPNGVPYPLGTMLYTSLGLTEWTMVSGTPGFLEQVPAASKARGSSAADGAKQSAYPAYQVVYRVSEIIQWPQATQADLTGDSTLTIALGDDPTQPLDIMQRIITGPDGGDVEP